MTVEQAKKEARKRGFIELRPGVWLETGRQALEDATEEEREAAKFDIDEDGFYIVTTDGIFDTVMDDDITEIIKQGKAEGFIK